MWKERQFFPINNNMMKVVILALVAAAVVLGAPGTGRPEAPLDFVHRSGEKEFETIGGRKYVLSLEEALEEALEKRPSHPEDFTRALTNKVYTK